MKWKASPFSSSRSSGMSGWGGAKELCTERIVSLLPMARPAESGRGGRGGGGGG